MDEGISKVIKQLQEKKKEFLAKAERIETMILSLQELFGAQMVLPETLPMIVSAIAPSTKRYVGMSIGEAAVSFLAEMGAPQKTRSIVDALGAGGVKSSNPYRAIYNALNNREDVVMDEMKRWGLKKWAEG